MIPLECCAHKCPDTCYFVYNSLYPSITFPYNFVFRWEHWVNVQPGKVAYCSHTCNLDCNEYRRRRGGGGSDPFYELFRRLPYEMKMHCLSYVPTFHMLANPAFWIEEDPLHYLRIMKEPHTQRHYDEEDDPMRPKRPECIPELHLYDLHQTYTDMYVGYRTIPYRKSYDTRPYRKKCFHEGKMDESFGTVNRYPSCYYRKCEHFAQRSEWSNKDVRDRYSQIRRCTGCTGTINGDCINHFLEDSRELRVYEDYLGDDLTYREVELKELDDPEKVGLERGMYYWEFVNHNWEDIATAVEGDRSRQKHFSLDPSSAEPKCRRERMYMSLMYRRVVQPSEENDDTYQTLRYFELDTETHTIVYFFFDEDFAFRRDHKYGYEPRLVYKHTLTPTVRVRVNEYHSIRTEGGYGKKVFYYTAEMPKYSKLYSLDRNRNTVRLNFYIDVCDMSHEEKSSFGSALVKLVHSEADMGYAFISHDWIHCTKDAVDVFDFFYH